MTLIRQALIALMLTAALAACGVRGDPEPPPASTDQQ